MEQIKLDIVPAGISPVAHASQFDNGRQIRFNLFNQGTPYTLTGAETVTMVVNGEEENITNTSDNYVIWDVAEEDCEDVGVIGCEIRIVLGSMLIGSKNFFLEVEMDPYDGKNIRIVTVGPADICTFETTLPEPLQSVIVDIVATGGNGTADNPIPIVGYSEANITANGNVITIAFGQTVYGGVLDVTRGKLHVTHFIKDSFVYGETALIAINQYNIANFGIVVSTPFKFPEGAISNCLPRQYTSGSATQTPGFFINNSNELYIRVESITASTVSDFVTWANANLQILFTLATPFDIDLTPQVISAVVGTNNVFADCGQTTVKYLEAGE